MACIVTRRNLKKLATKGLKLQTLYRRLYSNRKITVVNKNIKVVQTVDDFQSISKPQTKGSTENINICNFDRNSTKPVVLLLGWLFAKPSHMRKYEDLYLRLGFDVLVVQIRLGQVLMPQRAQLVVRELCDLLIRSDTQRILVHAFSVGAYLFGEVLVKMLEYPELYANISHRLCGQILDSPVDYYGIPKGFSKAMSENSYFRSWIQSFLEWYMKSLSSTVTKHYIRSSNVFLANELKLPSRFLYSLSDPVCEPAKIEEKAEEWRRKGIDADTNFWNNARHVSMYMKYPVEYENTVVQFIRKLESKERCVLRQNLRPHPGR